MPLDIQGAASAAILGPASAAVVPKSAAPKVPAAVGNPTPPTPDASQAPPSSPSGDVTTGTFTDLSSSLLGAVANLQQVQSEPGPNPPPPVMQPPPPRTPQYNPLQAWGSPAMMLALVGSLLTRRPLTAALTAAGDVMNAYKQGDQQAAQNAISVWKTQTANALNLQKYELDAYSKAVQSHQTDQRNAIAEVSANATAFKDEPMLAALQTGGLPAVIDLMHKRAKTGSTLAVTTNTLDKEHKFEASGGAATQAYLNNRFADWIPAYVLNGFNKAYLPPLAYYSKSDDRQVFDQGVSDFMKGYNIDPVQLSSRKSTVEALTGSMKKMELQYQQAKLSENTFAKQWENIQQNYLSKGAPPTNLGPLVNNFLQTGSVNSGDPTTVAYVTALGTLAEEYAKVISGSTGAQGSTVSAQEFARTLFQSGYSKDQIAAAIQAAQSNMAAREQQYPAQINQIQTWISSIPSGNTSPTAPLPDDGSGDGSGDGNQPTGSVNQPTIGTGSSQNSPVDLANDPNPQGAFNALPSGSYYINPADRKVYQKK